MPIHHTKTKLRTDSKTWRIILGWFFPLGLPKRQWARRALYCFLALIIALTGTAYGIARWYMSTVPPQTVGVSFIPDYASYLGVDPQQTMDALLHIGVRQFRLVSYWSDGEPTHGNYDFSQLDWEFSKAEAGGAKITLSLGLRQPRWPECHPPTWVDTTQPASNWQPALENYMSAVVNRYKASPALDSYQVENEFFLRGFGQCSNFERGRLVAEYNLVKRLDPHHKAIVNRSNNGLGIAIGAPRPDEYGVSIYKRVWDANLSHRYLEYPFPAWYYAFLAGAQRLHDGRDLIAHELQAEAWAPSGQQLPTMSLAEQNKSLDGRRLADRFKYGRATGLPEVYLWGAEYWYFRAQVLHDPSLWNVAKHEF
jgi:hypothetical protein